MRFSLSATIAIYYCLFTLLFTNLYIHASQEKNENLHQNHENRAKVFEQKWKTFSRLSFLLQQDTIGQDLPQDLQQSTNDNVCDKKENTQIVTTIKPSISQELQQILQMWNSKNLLPLATIALGPFGKEVAWVPLYVGQSIKFENEEEQFVNMGKYGISTQKTLYTEGLGPCISIGGFEKQSDIAFMTHCLSDESNSHQKFFKKLAQELQNLKVQDPSENKECLYGTYSIVMTGGNLSGNDDCEDKETMKHARNLFKMLTNELKKNKICYDPNLYEDIKNDLHLFDDGKTQIDFDGTKKTFFCSALSINPVTKSVKFYRKYRKIGW